MLKLIKMDFYRLFSSKALRAGVIASAILSAGYIFASLGIIGFAKLFLKSDPAAAEQMGQLLSQLAWMNGVNLSTIAFGATSILALFVGCMVSASFIGSEQACGYTKNFAGQLSNKGYMAISKFITTSAVQVIILTIYTVVAAVLGRLVFAKYITGFDVKHLLWALALRLLLHIAMNTIVIFVCSLTKSHAVGMVAGCIFGLGVTNVAYGGIDILLGVMKIKLSISDYMPDSINLSLGLDTVQRYTGKGIAVALICITVFLLANYYTVRRRDVR